MLQRGGRAKTIRVSGQRGCSIHEVTVAFPKLSSMIALKRPEDLLCCIALNHWSPPLRNA